jgi:hypothetical protein
MDILVQGGVPFALTPWGWGTCSLPSSEEMIGKVVTTSGLCEPSRRMAHYAEAEFFVIS